MDEHTRRILNDARRTLERLDGIESEFEAQNEMRDEFVPLRREPLQPVRTPESQAQQADWRAWDDWCKAHVQNGLLEFADMLGEEIGRSDREINARLAALETVVGELRAAREVEQAAKVVDLPNFLRKRNDAA
jgi:hypothetical protein